MTKYDEFWSVAIAFAAVVALIPVLRPLSHWLGLVDKPGGRKLHEGDIPIIGGVAMFFGMFAGLFMLPDPGYALVPLASACAVLFVVGVVDDRFHINAGLRMGAQVVATLIMIYGAGLSLTSIGDPFGTGEIVMGRFTLLFTLLVSVTMINAYNLIDGADGLAGSLAIVALLSLAAASGVGHPTALASLTVCAAIFGFLVFNFPTLWNRPVRTFMGDAGSTLLGFTIVWLTLGISNGPDRMISPVHCLWFASVPIYDLLTCFVRRAMKRRSPFQPGRDHFHHRLLSGGFHVREMLIILTGLQVIYALVGLLGHFAGVADVFMFAGWAALGISQRYIIRFIALHRRAFALRRRQAETP